MLKSLRASLVENLGMVILLRQQNPHFLPKNYKRRQRRRQTASVQFSSSPTSRNSPTVIRIRLGTNSARASSISSRSSSTLTFLDAVKSMKDAASSCSLRSSVCFHKFLMVFTLRYVAFYANCTHRWRTSTYWPKIVPFSVPVNTLTPRMQPGSQLCQMLAVRQREKV